MFMFSTKLIFYGLIIVYYLILANFSSLAILNFIALDTLMVYILLKIILSQHPNGRLITFINANSYKVLIFFFQFMLLFSLLQFQLLHQIWVELLVFNCLIFVKSLQLQVKSKFCLDVNQLLLYLFQIHIAATQFYFANFSY